MGFFFALGVSIVWAVPAVKEIEGLVRIEDIDPAIAVDLRYATENNFTKKKVYPANVCVLCKQTAQKLASANAEFRENGYSLKVWDAYRPAYVQQIFWELVADDRYVADPKKGVSIHTRAGAVDVTLIDDNSQEIEMPSAFDDFSEKASLYNPFMSSSARKNAEYLRAVMVKHGFIPYEHEWWHFVDTDWKNFMPIDVKLERFIESGVVIPETLRNLNERVNQALVLNCFTGDSNAKLTAWVRKTDGWQSIFEPMEAVVGKNGFAPEGKKVEGDGCTPSGIYRLGTAFGYALEVDTKLDYRQTTENDFWVDDSSSTQYNQWVQKVARAKSFERLKRDDVLYKYAIVVEYNTAPVVPGKGSAIFIHLWRGPGKPTAGCIALSEMDMLKLLRWLDKGDNPVIILGEE